MDELVVGTYEGFLLGYSLRSDDSVSEVYNLQLSLKPLSKITIFMTKFRNFRPGS